MTSGAEASSTARRLEVVHGLPDSLDAALAAGERALYDDGDLRVSRECFETAYQLAELAGDVHAMARAAIGLAGLWVSERRTVTGAVMLQARLQHCLSLLDQSSSLPLRIRVRLAGEADYVRGEHDAITAVLAEARAADDALALAEALSLAHHCLLGPEHVAHRRELARDLIRVSFSTDRRSDRLMGLLWQTIDAYAEGDPHAGRLLAELRELLSERSHPAVAFVVSAIEVMLAIRAGLRTPSRWPSSAPGAARPPVTSTASGGRARSWSPSAGTRAASSSCCPCSARECTPPRSARSMTQRWQRSRSPPP